MSNALAIAAVTATLRTLLEQQINQAALVPGFTPVTTHPLDRARSNNEGNQVNLLLYHVETNAGWRNQDLPRQVKPGEVGTPPLALNLYYLVTVYGRDDDHPDALSHRLLGKAMAVLHDHPLLGADEIRLALPNNDLHEQPERIRITPQPFSLEEQSKLWGMFQTQYRMSVAYQVTVVLIESNRPVQAALPVLQRGQNDLGWQAQADLASPFPTLSGVVPPAGQSGARLGEPITIQGFHLDGSNVLLTFNHARLDDPIQHDLPNQPSPHEIVFTPASATAWPVGWYTLAATVSKPDEQDRTTNEVSFALLPSITSLTIELLPDRRLLIECTPDLQPNQRISVLLGSRELRVATPTAQTNSIEVALDEEILPGEYVVRLRVDGVDSIPYALTGDPPRLGFADSQKVTI